MAQSKRGYLIPQNTAPTGYRCLLVFCPDDDEFQRNLAGAIHQLTKWTSHDRDGTQNASDVARVWREAYDETMTCGWDRRMIMTCDNGQFQALVDAVTGLTAAVNSSIGEIVASMAVSNNTALSMDANLLMIKQAIQGLDLSVQLGDEGNQITNLLQDCVNCGDVIITLPPSDPPIDPSNPPGGGTHEQYLAELCRHAHYMFDEYLIAGYDNLVAYQSGLAGIGASAVVAILVASGVGVPLVLVIALVEILVGVIAAGNSSSIRQEIIDAKEDVICALYNSDGSASGLVAYQDALKNIPVSQTALDVVSAFIDIAQLNQLYGLSIPVPAGYVAPDACENCINNSSPLPIVLDACYPIGGWYNHDNSTNPSIEAQYIYDAGVNCDTDVYDASWEDRTGVMSGNAEFLFNSSFDYNPPVNQTMYIDAKRTSTFSTGLIIKIRNLDTGVDVHTETGPQVGGWITISPAYVLQAGSNYRIKMYGSNVNSHRLSLGGFTNV